MTTQQRNIGINCIVAFFILLFTYTASSKLFSISQFQFSLKMSPLLRKQAVSLSWLVIVAEYSIAALLVFPKTRLPGLFLASLIMLAFTLYIGYMLFALPKRDLPCSCGGVVSWLSWRSHLVFNTVLTLLGMVGTYWEYIRRRSDPAFA